MKGGRLTFSEDYPKQNDSVKAIKKVKSILKKSSVAFNGGDVKNNKNISFSTDVNNANSDSNIDDNSMVSTSNDVKVSVNEIVSVEKKNGKGNIRFVMPEKEIASEQHETQVTIKVEEGNRKTGSQQEAMKPIKMEKKKGPKKSKASSSTKRSRSNNISIEDLLNKLNMLQYMDDLVDMGCDSIENAVFANVDDLVNDGHMKKIHAKVFVKAAKKVMEKQRSSNRRKKGGN